MESLIIAAMLFAAGQAPAPDLPAPVPLPAKKDRLAGFPKEGGKTVVPHDFVIAYDALDSFVAMYGASGEGRRREQAGGVKWLLYERQRVKAFFVPDKR